MEKLRGSQGDQPVRVPEFQAGVYGILVWNDEELFARLRQMLKGPNIVQRMGRAGVEMATEWSWDIVASQWEQRIIDVLEGADASS